MSNGAGYNVVLSQRARRFFERSDAPLQRRLDRCFDQLKLTPRHHSNVKALTGELGGFFRYRVGDYRVVYAIDESTRAVEVIIIAHRSQAYG